MSLQNGHSRRPTEPSAEVFAEAAAWIARLHGPNRSLQTDKGLRRWLDADAAHASAFEAMTAAWEVTGRIPAGPFPKVSRWERMGYRQGFVRSALAVAAAAVLAVAGFIYLQRSNGVGTTVGEQRLLTLQDGTRVFLNTSTRIVVQYEQAARRVRLESGEALFDVARQAGRPFVVEAGGRQVRAIGTAFVVRDDPDRLTVTLVEGKVAVSEPGTAVPAYLSPGQRLTLTGHGTPQVDRPSIEKATAWRRGLVDFETTELRVAVEEMNRYSERKLVVRNTDAAKLPITGVFRAGDSSSFAAAVARAYGLQVSETPQEIRLEGVPLR